MAVYKNLRGATAVTTELVAPGSSYNISRIQVANVKNSGTGTISLFLQNAPVSSASSTFTFISKKIIQNGDYLTLTNEIPKINSGFGLYATIAASDEIDIFIST